MTTTSSEFLSARIATAVASYGNLRSGDVPLKASLTSGLANFTNAQADAFVAQYKLIDQLPNVSLNGFSATVFLGKTTGKHVIAMRGTEETVLDLLVQDVLSIGGNGFANTQAVEMIRYYKRLSTSKHGVRSCAEQSKHGVRS